jgi:hypothetical protein
MDLAAAVKFALSDEAQEIYKKEGKEGLEKFFKKTKGISIKKAGGAVRAMKNGGAVMKGRGPKFKGQS